MNQNGKKDDFNRIIKVVFTLGGFLTFMTSYNKGQEMSIYYGDLALYGLPLLSIIYASCLFAILSIKKIIWVWITFGWIFINTILEFLIFNISLDSPQFTYSIVSSLMLICSISGFLFIKKDGKSGWTILFSK